jgi:NAD(P)-dependent dehydrogenase (short-subunit alcohol dehydrogenase family)
MRRSPQVTRQTAKLDNKVALVAGSPLGTGAAIAQQLAKERSTTQRPGWRVKARARTKNDARAPFFIGLDDDLLR